MYTVKRLESGGFEVEFPCAEYLPMIRDQLDKRYPTIRWHDSACKQEATLKVPRPGVSQSTGRHRARTPGCQLLVQLGNPVLEERRLWVTDVKQSSLGQHHAGAWIDTELCVIYRSVQRTVFYCTVIYCIIQLYFTQFSSSIINPAVLDCLVLYCTVLYNTSPNSASSIRLSRYSSTYCNVLHYTVLSSTASRSCTYRTLVNNSLLRCTVLYCAVLCTVQYFAELCVIYRSAHQSLQQQQVSSSSATTAEI